MYAALAVIKDMDLSKNSITVSGRLRIRVVQGGSGLCLAKWLELPATFEELKILACSLLRVKPERTLLTLQRTPFDSLEILRENDVVELVEELGETSSSDSFESDEWVEVNVGGSLFTTTKLTLTVTEPESIFAKMLCSDTSGRGTWTPRTDKNGAILIDRSGTLFEHLLTYLRTGKLIIPQTLSAQVLHAEAEFYNFERLLKELTPSVSTCQSVVQISGCTSTRLTRADVVRALIVTPSTQELRFQGIDLEGADLSKLDLRFINFRMANLRNTNLSYANLSYANLDRADLTSSILDHAVMFGVKLTCATMEKCSLQSVNMDDPAGLRANLEGVNLRNAVLDNSQLKNSNFRVANLKFASMKNCELQQASFPGANMEKCDLSGSNLFEANLRGANLVETNFGHLANAVHMSQF